MGDRTDLSQADLAITPSAPVRPIRPVHYATCGVNFSPKQKRPRFRDEQGRFLQKGTDAAASGGTASVFALNPLPYLKSRVLPYPHRRTRLSYPARIALRDQAKNPLAATGGLVLAFVKRYRTLVLQVWRS